MDPTFFGNEPIGVLAEALVEGPFIITTALLT